MRQICFLHKNPLLLQRYEEALAETKRAVELEPENARYHDSLGVTLHAGGHGQWDNSRRIQASELLPGDLGFLLNSDGSDWTHVLIFAGYDENGQRLWVHCTAGSGVILNTPSYEGRLILRRPTVAVLG